MGLDALKNILEQKIESLNNDIVDDEKQINSIDRFLEIIGAIKENPYILFTSGGEKYVQLLDLKDFNFPILKKIYDGYMLFGRDAIPQISLVDEAMEKIDTNLKQKVCFLSDLAVTHQANIIIYNGYKSLASQIFDDDVLVTDIDSLRGLLDGSDLSLEEKNNILKAIINKNNIIYRKRCLEELENKNENSFNVEEDYYSEEITALKNDLKNSFGDESLRFLHLIDEALCESGDVSEFGSILEKWNYSLGKPYCDIIDGIIKIKTISILELKDAFGDNLEEVSGEIATLGEQISLLSEYKDSITRERNAEEFEISGQQNEYERAINEYNSDPLSYPNRVLFFSNAVGRELDSIKNPETLRDVFLLLEKLKKDDAHGLSKWFSYGEARELKPSKKGRQARVRYVALDNNVYVVLQILEKKADMYLGEERTLRRREKECLGLKGEINNDRVLLDDMVEVTRVHSDKLFSLVSKGPTTKIGGAS